MAASTDSLASQLTAVSMVVNKTYWGPTGMPNYQLPPRGTRHVAISCLFAEILPRLEPDRMVPKDP